MRPPDEEEYQRFLGFPVSRWTLDRGGRGPRRRDKGTATASGGSIPSSGGAVGGQGQVWRPGAGQVGPGTDQLLATGPLGLLLDAWCERRDLLALARVLPAYTRDGGRSEREGQLLAALEALCAERHLPEDEQHTLERIVLDAQRIGHP
jgi:hypothetical protein